MASIREIAKRAGVSTATVSRVINNSGNVSQTTYKKVINIIKELNYDPKDNSYYYHSNNTKIVGIIIPDLQNQFYERIISGIQEVLKPLGYELLISFDTAGDVRKYEKFINTYRKINVAGIICSAFTLPEYQKIDLPFVMFDSGNIQDNIVRIVSDNKTGGKLCVDILSNKTKNVIIQHLDLRYPTVQERIEGMIDELNFKKIPYTIQAQSLKDLKHDPHSLFSKFDLRKYDAVITPNDLFAASIIKEADAMGLSIPQDFQLVGYDNNNLDNFTSPTISTIDQQPRLIGNAAANRLLGLINGSTNHNNTIIPVKAIKRNSTL